MRVLDGSYQQRFPLAVQEQPKVPKLISGELRLGDAKKLTGGMV